MNAILKNILPMYNFVFISNDKKMIALLKGFIFAMVSFILWGFCYPLTLLIALKKNHKFFNEPSFQNKFGYLYRDFTIKHYYW